jgi:amino-acid N-acetyltransferase
VSFEDDGGLLRELYSRDGVGTLIAADTFGTIRQATAEDAGGLLALIQPLEAAGVLVPRSREQLELEADHFVVIERDGAIIGCGALYPQPDGSSAEIACVAIDPAYRNGGRGHQVLEWLEQEAARRGLERVFVLSARTMHWFRERGYEPADVDALPDERRGLYNWQRNSKVFVKEL